MKLLRLLANLGYGSRREVQTMFAAGFVTDAAGNALSADSTCPHEQVRVDGVPLDPPPGVCLALHKPTGYLCSHADTGRLVYRLLPPRMRARKPQISSIGRLDADSSGLLLLTDDGALLHRIASPRHGPGKTYRVQLDRDLRGDERDAFASGEMLLRGEDKPLRPAQLSVLGPRQAQVTIHEGRYHQVRRMFAAVGNHVLALQRVAIGRLWLLRLGENPPPSILPADAMPIFLAEGQWQVLNPAQVAATLSANQEKH